MRAPRVLVVVGCLLALSTAALAANLYRTTILALGGIQIGSAGTQLNSVKVVQVDDQNVGAAAASTTVTLAVTVTGVALGDALLSCTPVQDDAAWDECSLSCFIEAADTVKLIVHADATGCDPAATNDYVFTFIERS